MSFNRRARDPFGPRFGELMGKHCHAAITAAARKNKPEYDRLVADIYQMLDSVEQETRWTEDAPKARTTPVAPEAQPAATSAGPETEAAGGPDAAQQPSGAVPSPNKRPKRTSGTKRPGVGTKTNTKLKPNLPGAEK